MSDTRSAFISVIGRPNVGKSSLLNALLGRKVAIVSEKPQTTRTKITGVLTSGDVQLVFIDTPGLLRPKNALGTKMVKAVADGMADVDAAVLVIEPSRKIAPAEEELIQRLQSRRTPAILAVNKIDTLTKKEDLLEVIALYSARFDFAAVVPISALTGDGLPELLREAERFAAPSPFYFDPDTLTDQPERVIAAEIVREKFLRLLDKEVPHGIAAFVERMSERESGDITDIDVTIFCERESHKRIIIGKGGSMLKKAGSAARAELEDFFGCKVNLQLWVKVKENWRNRDGVIHNLGLD